MKDPGKKRFVVREVTSSGKIFLKPTTIERIRKNDIEEANPLAHAQIAGIAAAKETAKLLPNCHQIPLESVKVVFDLQDKFIEVKSTVKATARSGIEMESLLATTVALNALLEQVKNLEEDEEGLFPDLWITDIRIDKKAKKPAPDFKSFSSV